MRRHRLTLLGATAVVAVLGLLAAGGAALAKPSASTRPETNTAAAAAMSCERRASWQRWYATPSRANAIGVWACGWYNSTVYDLVGRVWDTEPNDGVATSLRITWGNGTSQSVPGTAEGQPFSLRNPVEGTPPTIRECEATCGVGVRPDYLPERNKLAGVFRVMTYNIHHGYPPGEDFCTGTPTLWKAASTIRRNDPDIVVINEINRALNPKEPEGEPDPGPCDEAHQPRDLANMLDMNYVYCNDWQGKPGVPGCGVDDQTNNSGNAILSRYPIAFKGHVVLPHEQATENAQRGLIWAEVTVNGTRIPVYATHLVTRGTEAKESLRQSQLQEIVRTINANGHAPRQAKTILAGDMNTADVQQLWRLWSGGPLSLNFNDGFKHISPEWAGYTVPVKESRSQANERFDYVFTSPLFRHPTRGTAVPWSQSSDHLPVIVDIYQ